MSAFFFFVLAPAAAMMMTMLSVSDSDAQLLGPRGCADLRNFDHRDVLADTRALVEEEEEEKRRRRPRPLRPEVAIPPRHAATECARGEASVSRVANKGMWHAKFLIFFINSGTKFYLPSNI